MENLVEFQNWSNRWLRGMIHRPSRVRTRRGGPSVVFFHGFTGDRMESHWMFVKCARALAQAGIASLRFDFYGSGESDGQFADVTLRGEIADAAAAVEYFRRQKGIDPDRIGLLGLSMGGAVAASIAVQSGARALVLWAALAHPTDLRALAAANTKPVPGMEGAQEYAGHLVSSRFLDKLEQVVPLKAISGFTRPTLIIHPEKDEYLPLNHPEDYFQAVGATVKEKVIIPGADHTFSSVVWERDVISRTVDWFTRHLK
ncbi:MAG TPA: alpha/beta fold hydrolase [Terriglobia bacterium]|nr:alpha/beta fold hydrolase [Terriglobia bacterium]